MLRDIAPPRGQAAPHAGPRPAARPKTLRRSDPVPAETFLDRVDGRERGRHAAALILIGIAPEPGADGEGADLHPAQAPSTSARMVGMVPDMGGAGLHLAQAASRAVRSGDVVGLLPDGAVCLWLDGIPAEHLPARVERLRLTIQRLGVRGAQLRFAAVPRTDTRSASDILRALASPPQGGRAVAP